MNTIHLTGNLGSDIEARQSGAGTAFASFSIAVNRKVKDEVQTTWIRCVAFGDLATNLDGLGKGARLMVEGRLSESTYTDKDGNERKNIELLLDDAGISQRFAQRNAVKNFDAAEPF